MFLESENPCDLTKMESQTEGFKELCEFTEFEEKMNKPKGNFRFNEL